MSSFLVYNAIYMKNIILILIVLLLIGGGYWFVSNKAETPVQVEEGQSEATLMESETEMEVGNYSADTSASSITWQAGKPAISGYVHTGTFAIKSGEVVLTETSLTGEFVIDVNSLKITSLGGGKAGQESALEGHLKSGGFFDSNNYPTATFKITDVSPKILPSPEQSDYVAKGELTLKGQTHVTDVPMRVVVAGNGDVTMSAELAIDRTLWGVNFGSAKVVDRITDQVIGDTVNLNLVVKLVKN